MLQYKNNLEMKISENQLSKEAVLDKYEIEYLFHMTHIDNVANILEHGLLPHGNQYQNKDISDCDVNSRRSRAEPIYHKPIHSYVPFYFNPRNPMLYYRQDQQNDIVILILSKKLLLREGVLFTDGNASSDHTLFSNDVEDLNMIDWKCIHGKYWNDYTDGKRKKMAEVLVPNFVDVKNLEGIICNNSLAKAKIDALTHNKITSLVHTKLYF